MRKFAGEFGAAKTITVAAMDEEQDEALASLEAIEWAWTKGIQHLHLESDSNKIVSAINGSSSSIIWTTSNVVHDCLVKLKSVNKWVCKSFKRTANSCIHTLAKYARANNSNDE